MSRMGRFAPGGQTYHANRTVSGTDTYGLGTVMMWVVALLIFLSLRKDLSKSLFAEDDMQDQEGNSASSGLPDAPNTSTLTQPLSYYQGIASSCVNALNEFNPYNFHTVFEKVATALQPIETKNEMNAVIYSFGVQQYDEPWYTAYDDWSGGLIESLEHQAVRLGYGDETFNVTLDGPWEKRIAALNKINAKLGLVNRQIQIPEQP